MNGLPTGVERSAAEQLVATEAENSFCTRIAGVDLTFGILQHNSFCHHSENQSEYRGFEEIGHERLRYRLPKLFCFYNQVK